MKFASSLVFLAAGAVQAAAAGTCNSDNCARAVTGTRKGAASASAALADCASFLKATYYPGTVTETATVTVYPFTATLNYTNATVTSTTAVYAFTEHATVTTTTTTQALTVGTTTVVTSVATATVTVGTTTVVAKRAVTTAGLKASLVIPCDIPTYASACDGAVRYSSACSCFGATATTTTMPTPTSTVTVTVTGTSTVSKALTATKITTLSLTTTVTTFVGYTTTQSLIQTVDIASTATATVQATATVIPVPSDVGVCGEGKAGTGPTTSCKTNCKTYNLRIEGANGPVYEGPIVAGPQDVTLPSGGTHKCDGTNNGAHPTPAGTPSTAIAAAAGYCGFPWDGTWSNQFQDFFITKIGVSDSNDGSNRYWGVLEDFQYTPSGGCQEEPGTNQEILWAYDAFNKNYFLNVQPRTATLKSGSAASFVITDGQTGIRISGATFGGQTSDANGNIQYIAGAPGTYRIKAERSDSIRSPVVVITVTA